MQLLEFCVSFVVFCGVPALPGHRTHHQHEQGAPGASVNLIDTPRHIYLPGTPCPCGGAEDARVLRARRLRASRLTPTSRRVRRRSLTPPRHVPPRPQAMLGQRHHHVRLRRSHSRPVTAKVCVRKRAGGFKRWTVAECCPSIGCGALPQRRASAQVATPTHTCCVKRSGRSCCR